MLDAQCSHTEVAKSTTSHTFAVMRAHTILQAMHCSGCGTLFGEHLHCFLFLFEPNTHFLALMLGPACPMQDNHE